ncbi:MAG: DUF3293 domain-containing protein [Nitriliruptoraceae bacterium]
MVDSAYGTTDMFAAFHASVVTLILPAGTVTLTFGARPPRTVPTPGGIITAANPGYTQAEALNARASRALHALLHRRQLWHVPTVSAATDGTHREVGFFVTGVTCDELVRIGRAFGQQAVFWLSDMGLGVVACGQLIPYRKPSREPT